MSARRAGHSGIMNPEVTVIIPTLGVRASSLRRAISSALDQGKAAVRVIVVVNGDRFNQALVDELRSRADVQLHHLATAGVSAARYAGRGLVETEYFAFLDDDDEFLPDGLTKGLDYLEKNSDVDLVVTNGYRIFEDRCELCFPQFGQMTEDPALDLFRENWLTSAGGLYRTDRFDVSFFSDLPNYFELTVLALKVALQKKIVRIDTITHLLHSYGSDRVSVSEEYFEHQLDMLDKLASLTTRPDVLKEIGRKRAKCLNGQAIKSLHDGRYWEALRSHISCLAQRDGYRYISASLHFLVPISKSN